MYARAATPCNTLPSNMSVSMQIGQTMSSRLQLAAAAVASLACNLESCRPLSCWLPDTTLAQGLLLEELPQLGCTGWSGHVHTCTMHAPRCLRTPPCVAQLHPTQAPKCKEHSTLANNAQCCSFPSPGIPFACP
jgi:hypothetical protein